jgi:hypothetical protein
MSDQTEHNIEVVKKGVEAFSTADIETMMSLFDDNIEWVQPGDSAVSGTYHGKGELGQFFGLRNCTVVRRTKPTPPINFYGFCAPDDTENVSMYMGRLVGLSHSDFECMCGV